MQKEEVVFVSGRVLRFSHGEYHEEFYVRLQLDEDSSEKSRENSALYWGDAGEYLVTIQDSLHPRVYEDPRDNRPLWKRRDEHGFHGLWGVVGQEGAEVRFQGIEIGEHIVSFDLQVVRKDEGGGT